MLLSSHFLGTFSTPIHALPPETKLEELVERTHRLAAGEQGIRFPRLEGPLAPLGEALNRLAQQLDAQHEREEGEFGFRALLEQSPDMMIACDLNGRVRFINNVKPPATAADVVGMNIFDNIVPEDHERVAGYFQRVLQNGETITYESRAAIDIGPEWYGVRVGPVRASDGRIVGLAMIITDITEPKRAQLRLEQSNRELEAFAFVASHDLQEPLRKIQTFGERLKARATELSPESRDSVERMQAAATRMRRLIDDLLTFSRVSSKAQPFTQVDLTAVARDVLEDLETSIQRAGALVELGPLPTLEAEPLQMRQLLQNLLSNALKFRREGVPPVITVRAARREGPPAAWALEVKDNGIGFDEKYVERIFTVFQRLHGRGQYEGTGIGLAICRKIAERHGGSITAHSTPGAGATFIITLPPRQPQRK